MLFNSFEFLLAFLPVVVAGYFAFNRRSGRWGNAWLVAASLFFYAWWRAEYLALLAARSDLTVIAIFRKAGSETREVKTS